MLGQAEDLGELRDLFTAAQGFYVKNAAAATANTPVRRLPAAPPGADEVALSPSLHSDINALDLTACRRELARTRLYLEAAIRAQEATAEELRRTRQDSLAGMEQLQKTQEELQSSNEELLSINEELSAAKDQLQIGNEELLFLNDELETRNGQLSRVSDELNNILSAVDIPIVMLDEARRIRRFTPPAQSLFGLLPRDIGRPIAHFRLGIAFDELDRIISAVMHSGQEAGCELEKSGHWYSLRVRPFRSGEKRVEGVLMALVDIHDLKQRQRALQQDRNFVAAILDAARDLLVLVADKGGRITQFNDVCQRLSGYSMDEVKGRPLWEFLANPEQAARLKASFAALDFANVQRNENHWLTKSGSPRLIAWTITPLLGETGAVESLIATGIDQTDRAEAQVTAQESAATVRALLETAAQAIVAVDQNGRIVLANAATEKMFGYSRQQLLGLQIEELLPKHLREGHVHYRRKWSAQPAVRPMGAALELTGLRRDGTEFPIEVSLSYLYTRQRMLAVSFISDVTERRKSEQTVLEYQKQLQRLAASLISDQETENRELARELHDVFSQELAALNMEVTMILHAAGARSRLAPRLAELGKKLSRLAEEIHGTSRQLHPSILEELGLEAALREECEALSQHSGLPVRFTAAGIPPQLPQEVRLSLYRIAQESLRNIRKHVGAAEVSVRLAGDGQGVRLRVEDSGDGFDVEQARKRGGLGLISMEERARLVNGTFSIRSRPGAGTLVEVFVPLH
jgi:PAS domain S-box-containing protein